MFNLTRVSLKADFFEYEADGAATKRLTTARGNGGGVTEEEESK